MPNTKRAGITARRPTNPTREPPNAVSAAMTAFAFAAVDGGGRPFRRPWADVRPGGLEPYQPAGPSQWMPRPCLAFPVGRGGQLYRAATTSSAQDWLWQCAACRAMTTSSAFGRCDRADARVLETGDFVATCPSCGVRRKWLLDDGRPCRARRSFSLALRDGFCRAVADGLKLNSVGPETYRGTTNANDPSAGDGDPALAAGVDLVAHEFVSDLDGSRRRVYLPGSAVIGVRAGQSLAGGEVWADVLPSVPRQWKHRNLAARWASLADAFGPASLIEPLRRTWFDHEQVRLPSSPGLVLAPAPLLAAAVRDVVPAGLWWDTGPMLPLYDWRAEAAVFPPTRLRRWDALRCPLPGDVLLDASIAERRISPRPPLGQIPDCDWANGGRRQRECGPRRCAADTRHTPSNGPAESVTVVFLRGNEKWNRTVARRREK